MRGLWLLILLVVGLEFVAEARSQTPQQPLAPDCSEAAVFLLLELWGKPTSLESIKTALPVNQGGRSAAELQVVVRRFGVDVAGVHLTKKQFPLDRPVIAYFLGPDADGEGEGHYALLQPIGVTGTVAQVIDYPFAPQVVDYKDLLENPRWTGIALMPQTFGEQVGYWLGLVGKLLIAGSLLAWVAKWAMTKIRFGKRWLWRGSPRIDKAPIHGGIGQ